MATALNELTSMPKLPITSGVMSAAPAAPKGYMGPKEMAPAMEELRGEIGAAEQRVGQADIGIERAKREEKAAELGIKAESLEQQVKDIEAMPERAELKAAREKLKGMEFVPTRGTVQDIAGLFSLIGVVGMVVGKGDAMRAMHAMNGMMEGHRKGRQDLFKQQLQEFDKNFKAMQAKVSTALAEYQEALEIKKTDREAGELRKQEALARSESPLLKAMDTKLGEVGTLNALKGAKEDFGTMVKMRNDLQAKVEDRELRRELMSMRYGGKKLSDKAEKAVGSNLDLMSNLSDLSRMVDKVKDEAAVFGLAGYLPQFLTQRAQSPEARQTLSLLQNITSKELKLRSGATVTVAEFARQRGFLPLETDSTEAIQDKITGLFDAIESETNGIAKRTNSSEIRSAVSEIPLPLSPSFRKETGGEVPAPTSKANVEEERSRAKAAIAAGKDENAVRARFKERTGQEL